MLKITGTSHLPVTFALHRYGFTYVVHGRSVLLLKPNLDSELVILDFAPTTWASYKQRVVLYAPDAGIALFSGVKLVLQETHGLAFSAPYSNPTVDGRSLTGERTLGMPDLNGLDIQRRENGWYSVSQGKSFSAEPRAALIEPGQRLVITRDPKQFAVYNGVAGALLYAEDLLQQGLFDKPLVPYVYPGRGVLAVGTPLGYAFSPDMGISWRHKRLPGFGIVADKAVLSVHDAGIYITEGWW